RPSFLNKTPIVQESKPRINKWDGIKLKSFFSLAATKIRNLPWVEKYQPRTLNDLISHQDILSTIQKFISEDRLPRLLLYGPPGTGKTSTILACAKQLCKDKEFGSMVLELNASDDGGIDIVRGPIRSYASTGTIFKKGFKLVILDEAEAMMQNARMP
uniref:Replication factor C subunit 5 n=1 Tax=Marmota marmota marmota TaxID=9994 RepID=A0A8C5YPG9_MARMA